MNEKVGKWPKMSRLDSWRSDSYHWHNRYMVWMMDPYERCRTTKNEMMGVNAGYLNA